MGREEWGGERRREWGGKSVRGGKKEGSREGRRREWEGKRGPGKKGEEKRGKEERIQLEWNVHMPHDHHGSDVFRVMVYIPIVI